MKSALVTGASSGIGKETALTLANAGYQVYAAARSVEKMAEEIFIERSRFRSFYFFRNRKKEIIFLLFPTLFCR